MKINYKLLESLGKIVYASLDFEPKRFTKTIMCYMVVANI